MQPKKIHFQGNAVTGNRNGFSGNEMLPLAPKSQQLLFISTHSFFHQLCSVYQEFLSPGNKEAWTPAGEGAPGLGQIQGCPAQVCLTW